MVETFLALDSDGNNAVDAKELAQALGKREVSAAVVTCHFPPTAYTHQDSNLDVAYAQKMIDEVDMDRNGQLDFFEFLRVVSASSESALGRMIVR